MLLPVTCLARRADEAAVIGAALEAKAAGAGHRAIAGQLGRPASTVRGWLRAFTAWAELVRQAFALAAGLVTDPPLPGPAGPGLADAVAAVAPAAVAAARFLSVGVVARWQLAAAVTSGMLLARRGRRG